MSGRPSPAILMFVTEPKGENDMADSPVVPQSARHDVSDILEAADGGRLVEEMDQALPELIRSVMRTKKSGSLTITLAVTVGTGNTVLVTPKLAVKTPRGVVSGAIFYADDQGNLSESDPRQMPLKNVTHIKGAQ